MHEMHEMHDGRDDERLEGLLRDALRTETQPLSVDVTSAELLRRIRGRRRERRWTFGVMGAAAAVLAVAIGVTTAPLVFDRPAAATPAATGPEAVTVREAAGSGVARDLVVEATPLGGPVRQLARFADPFPAHLPTSLAAGAWEWRARWSPDGYLAVAAFEPRGWSSDSIVAVLDAGHPDRAPLLVPVAGYPSFGWGPGGRLAITTFDRPNNPVLVDGPSWTTTSLQVPSSVMAVLAVNGWNGDDVVWTPDGRILAGSVSRGEFNWTAGTIDPSSAAPALVPGLPSATWYVTGPGPLTTGSFGGSGAGSSSTPRTISFTSRAADGTSGPEQTWYVNPPGTLLAGDPLEAADADAIWLLRYDPTGELSLLRVNRAGAPPSVVVLPWRGGEADTQLVSQAVDGSVVVVSAGNALGLAGRNGAVRTLPDGAHFAGWAVGAPLAVRTGSVSCGAAAAAAVAQVTVTGPAGTSAATVGVATSARTDPPADQALLAGSAIEGVEGGSVSLALPDGTCSDAWSASAFSPAEATNASAVGTTLAGRLAGEANDVGLLAIPAPARGDWIVRVTVWYHAPGTGVGASTDYAFLLRVRPLAPATPDPSDPGTLTLRQPTALGVGGEVGRFGEGSTGVAPGPVAFRESVPLTAGPTSIDAACAGAGSLRFAIISGPVGEAGPIAVPSVPDSAWVSLECGPNPLATTERTLHLAAAGSENILVVDRAALPGAAAPAWSVAVSQPVSVACTAPTLAAVSDFSLVVGGASHRTTVTGQWHLPAGTGDATTTLADVLAGPALHVVQPASDAAITIPAGLCVTSVDQAQTDANGYSSTSGSHGVTEPALSRFGLSQLEPGDNSLNLTIWMVGPDSARWDVTVSVHVRVDAPASPSPDPQGSAAP